MLEISNFWLSALISQVAPYLMFILVSKSTHPVSLVLSSQNAQCFYISDPLNIEILLTTLDNVRSTIYIVQSRFHQQCNVQVVRFLLCAHTKLGDGVILKAESKYTTLIK